MTNVPEIRFKGFTDAWEQRRLGDALSEKISNGIMNRPGRNSLNVRHINVVNLYTPSKIQPNELSYFDATEKDLQKCNVEVDDIFLTRSSLKLEGIAQANILLDDGDYVFDDHIMRIKLTSEFEPFFVKEALNHSLTKKDFMTKAKTGTMTTIGQDDITSSGITFPIKTEQTHIGQFFRALDNTLAIYKRKLDGLRELKKAYLQQMFPQSGETVPRLWFEGFRRDWEVNKLGDVANFNPRSTLPNTFEYVDLESVVGTSLVSHRTESKETAPSRAQRLARRGDVFFQMVRPYQMNNYLFDLTFDNYVFSTGYAQLRPNIHSYFLLCRLQEKCFVAKVLDRCTGTSYPAINSTDLAEIEISVTLDDNEQKAIGTFFRNLDTQIETQSKKIEKLKLLKSAYLQKMFV